MKYLSNEHLQQCHSLSAFFSPLNLHVSKHGPHCVWAEEFWRQPPDCGLVGFFVVQVVQTNIENLHLHIGAYKDIAGAQVAMNNLKQKCGCR